MGISDRHHFAWLRDVLASFERQTGAFAAIGRRSAEPALWCFGGQQLDPSLRYVRDALGPRTSVTFFDRFPNDATIRAQDINALENLPGDACDVLTLFRASMFITDPVAFLEHARRIVKPGGLALIDWLHGLSDAPVLNLAGDPRHGGTPTPFTSTYADPQFLAEFAPAFEALIRHVNHPPARVNLERPGTPLPLRARVARALGGGPRRHVTRATYLDVCRAELARAGKYLVEPALLEQYFKVVYRHARYFYRQVHKFNLYLLTVLEPVGKLEMRRHA